MTSEHEAQQASDIKRSHVHEGPKNHFLAFALSIALTVLAFLAIVYEPVLESWFVVSFILILAIVQAVIQALFWMHLKDRGHLQQRIFIIGGAVIAFTAIVMSLYWVWW